MKVYKNLFSKVAEPENLFLAWSEFRKGKGSKADVQIFEKNLEQNIFELSRELKSKKYRHGGYIDFLISDPKLRHIHKATVRDRVLHHALFQILNPIFEPTFIATSFSCRIAKGTHKGVEMVKNMLNKESRNGTRTCYALKCDIQKFFDSINHSVLIEILSKKIKDAETMELLNGLVESYPHFAAPPRERERERASRPTNKGIPIGNLTSQLFANIYMSEFDHFMKSTLKVKYYARYTDDFIIVSHDNLYLKSLIFPIMQFLGEKLKLNLHPKKIIIKKYSQGIDFLGYVILPHAKLIRKRTWKRMTRKFSEKIVAYQAEKISKEKLEQSLQSYLGILSHADSHKLRIYLKNKFWLG